MLFEVMFPTLWCIYRGRFSGRFWDAFRKHFGPALGSSEARFAAACAADRRCAFLRRTSILSRFGLQKEARLDAFFVVLDGQIRSCCQGYGNRRDPAENQIESDGKVYQSDKTYD